MSSRSIHVLTNGKTSCLRPTNPPLRVHTAFSLPIHSSVSIPVISLSQLSQKCCNEHGCAGISVNFLIISIPLGKHPEVGLLGHMIVLFIIFYQVIQKKQIHKQVLVQPSVLNERRSLEFSTATS